MSWFSSITETVAKTAAMVQEKVADTYTQTMKELEAEEARTSQKKAANDKTSYPLWKIWAADKVVLEDELKKRILNLSKDGNTFISSPLTQKFKFDMKDYAALAKQILVDDENLPTVRHKLVPTTMKEVEFWKLYFYAVEQLRDEMGLSSLLTHISDQDEDTKATTTKATPAKEKETSATPASKSSTSAAKPKTSTSPTASSTPSTFKSSDTTATKRTVEKKVEKAATKPEKKAASKPEKKAASKPEKKAVSKPEKENEKVVSEEKQKDVSTPKAKAAGKPAKAKLNAQPVEEDDLDLDELENMLDGEDLPAKVASPAGSAAASASTAKATTGKKPAADDVDDTEDLLNELSHSLEDF
eukprot:g1671.t1